jgi:hypothetical protein
MLQTIDVALILLRWTDSGRTGGDQIKKPSVSRIRSGGWPARDDSGRGSGAAVRCRSRNPADMAGYATLCRPRAPLRGIAAARPNGASGRLA